MIKRSYGHFRKTVKKYFLLTSLVLRMRIFSMIYQNLMQYWKWLNRFRSILVKQKESLPQR